MADVVEARLAGPVNIGTVLSTPISVPGDHTYVVKQVMVCNTNGIDAWFSLAINGTPATAANCMFFRFPIAANDTLCWDTALVLAAEETMQVISDQGNITLTVTGWDHLTV